MVGWTTPLITAESEMFTVILSATCFGLSNDAPKKLAELSEDLGEAMVGINEHEIELLMAERGK